MNALKTSTNYYQAAIGCYYLTSIDACNFTTALKHFLNILTVNTFTIYRNGKRAWEVVEGRAIPASMI